MITGQPAARISRTITWPNWPIMACLRHRAHLGERIAAGTSNERGKQKRKTHDKKSRSHKIRDPFRVAI
jgi:hypothetical protein